jgi:hypothetical protein
LGIVSTPTCVLIKYGYVYKMPGLTKTKGSYKEGVNPHNKRATIAASYQNGRQEYVTVSMIKARADDSFIMNLNHIFRRSQI